MAPLVQALAAARTREDSDRIAARLETVRQGGLSPTATLLLRRAQREVTGDKAHDALDDADDAVALQPESPVVWRERAGIRLLAGDRGGAEDDLGQALSRDPNDAVAWSALSHVEETGGHAEAAYAAWEHAVRLQPMMPDGARRLDFLRRRMLGDPT
ncbi:hypothetical protein [Rhizosaccharibacter radicis]|uniref:Tetratricopeptide repeat protein n=1 Tax=Rhizosaccharibacter radicis TaxID=2782605 RepID=A0ABT1VXN7_9PROT|nr:hypothetical protein [Acetobacteraceae bacterium KSS12]